jgi:hypothetical protein
MRMLKAVAMVFAAFNSWHVNCGCQQVFQGLLLHAWRCCIFMACIWLHSCGMLLLVLLAWRAAIVAAVV